MNFQILATTLCLIAALPADAAERKSRKAEKEAQDSSPILMSKTGGGDIWADVRELTAAANQGNRKAQAQLGELLLRGSAEHKVARDIPRAVAMLEQAARAGEPSAAFRIGMLLDDGEIVLPDRARALAYFRAAAAGGAGEAFYNIGAAYAGGRGVRPDPAEALGWLILAGKHGASTEAEKALRAQLEAKNGQLFIRLGESRAADIEHELAARKIVEWLPAPAPLVPLATAATQAAPKSDPPKPAAKQR